jgi:hypothetical protein
MDALNFLLETTENLNSGDVQMNEGLYLEMMNKLRDLHRSIPTTPRKEVIVRRYVPTAVEAEAPHPEAVLVNTLRGIFSLNEETIIRGFLMNHNVLQHAPGWRGFLQLLADWKTNNYAPETATAITTHPDLLWSMKWLMSFSHNGRTIQWRDLEFRDRFLLLPAVVKNMMFVFYQHNENYFKIFRSCLKTLAKQDPKWNDEMKLSVVLREISSPFEGKHRKFRNRLIPQTDEELAKLHEIEIEYAYTEPHPKLKVFTSKVQLGRTSCNESVLLLGIINAIHNGDEAKIGAMWRLVFGNLQKDHTPELLVSGITSDTKDLQRQYVCYEAIITYTQQLNNGGKK